MRDLTTSDQLSIPFVGYFAPKVNQRSAAITSVRYWVITAALLFILQFSYANPIGLNANRMLLTNAPQATFSIDPDSNFIAQQMKRRIFLRSNFWFGRFLRKGPGYFGTPNENGDIFKYTMAIGMELGFQTFGQRRSECAYHYPVYGIGISRVWFLKRYDLGKPWALYGFHEGNIIKGKLVSWNYRMSFGLSVGWDTYDPITNPDNVAIGSEINAYGGVGSKLSIKILPFMDFSAGFELIHFSNGNMVIPQKGINVLSGVAGIKVFPYGRRPERIHHDISAFRPSHEWYVYFGMGKRQVNFNYGIPDTEEVSHGINYLMTNISGGYNWHLFRGMKIGAGLDVTYDGTTNAGFYFEDGEAKKEKVPAGDKFGLSPYFSVEWVIDRFAVMIQPGYTILRKEFENSTPKFFQRIGFKYAVNDNIFIGMNLRAYDFHVAKYMEWIVGYSRPFGQSTNL